jgi:hypothetical protein
MIQLHKDEYEHFMVTGELPERYNQTSSSEWPKSVEYEFGIGVCHAKDRSSVSFVEKK